MVTVEVKEKTNGKRKNDDGECDDYKEENLPML